ncbi:hypothetical protein TIFTF001_016515 [Ficus carica]|uniref:Uncharacterized protein n=1 Tax=Ficus carica TaxID=3494 RepID=A0AA88D7H4_FICCA|nr:hypothetical protein TIFTF001_016515 [Ficus carica]
MTGKIFSGPAYSPIRTTRSDPDQRANLLAGFPDRPDRDRSGRPVRKSRSEKRANLLTVFLDQSRSGRYRKSDPDQRANLLAVFPDRSRPVPVRLVWKTRSGLDQRAQVLVNFSNRPDRDRSVQKTRPEKRANLLAVFLDRPVRKIRSGPESKFALCFSGPVQTGPGQAGPENPVRTSEQIYSLFFRTGPGQAGPEN